VLKLAGEPRMPASGATVTRLSGCWPSGALVAILLPGLDDAAFPARTMVSCCGATPEPWPGSPAGDRWPYVKHWGRRAGGRQRPTGVGRVRPIPLREFFVAGTGWSVPGHGTAADRAGKHQDRRHCQRDLNGAPPWES